MKKYFLIVVIVVMLLGLSVYLGMQNMNSKDVSAKNDEKLRIVTSFYPMYIATMNIVDGIQDVELSNLTKQTTGCLHDYQLSPQELIKIEKADIFIANGAGMESFLDKVISTYPKLNIISASEGIELLKNEDGEENPHLWVSISEYIKQINNITNRLGEVDSKNKDKYKENASKYIIKLEQEKKDMDIKLQTISKRDIVTFHEAFPYFAKEFNLNIVDVVEREPGTEPNPSELADAIKLIKDSGVKTLFAEPQYSKSAAETIAKEVGAKVYMLDPAVTGDLDKDAYIKIMNKNKEVLFEALK